MTSPANGKKMKIRVEGNTVILERVFDAPRTMTFQAFSTERHLVRSEGMADYGVHA